MALPGTDTRKGAVCLVVGCDRKSIYRNPRGKNTAAGYCARHKAFATSQAVKDETTDRKTSRPWTSHWGQA